MRRTIQCCNDFLHHAAHVGRLNNGSFGAVPQQVIKAQNQFREEWLAQPDALYFDISNGLDLRLQKVQQRLGEYLRVNWKNVSLVENATIATSTIAQRWARLLHQNENSTNKSHSRHFEDQYVHLNFLNMSDPVSKAHNFDTK